MPADETPAGPSGSPSPSPSPGPRLDGLCVHQAFERWAAATPDALAVAGPTGRLTYRELDERANRLARHLRELGVGPEVAVAVLAERSPQMMVAILAALKAGGCYLPLDPAYPEERLAYILESSRSAVLLTQEHLLARRPALAAGPARPFRLDADWPLAAAEPATPLAPQAELGNLAYVIYTSGSTGKPKGVEIEHRGLANLTAWYRRHSSIAPGARAVRSAGSAFDVSVFEVWSALTAGASLHIPEEELILSPPRLIDWLVRERITHCFLSTPVAEAMLEHPWPADAVLRELTTGGDRVHLGLRADQPFVLWNLYGPSENSVVTTSAQAIGGAGAVPAPPIGKPVDGVRVWLAAPDLTPAPAGEPGEILIGGVGLARGYRGRPDLTAERFLPDPSGAPGERLYRTGDLGRLLPSGDFDFIGRIDFQVKIRGFRIELGEIEAVLRRQPAVREAVVLARDAGDAGERGEKRLVGYVVPRSGDAPPAADELRAALGRELPDYMVPAAWVFLAALPLTPNGKVDRRALPAPEPGEESYVAPRSAVEERLAEIFAEVLHVERVGADDDFFALGGHSLKATQVLSRLRARLGVELRPRDLFAYPTVARLAAVLGGSVPEETAADGTGWEIPAVPRPDAAGFALPVSFAQQGLWFAETLLQGSPLYTTAFSLALDGALDPALLAAAAAAIVRRHESLRTTFRAPAGLPVQWISRQLAVELPLCDLAALPDAARAAEAARLAAAEARTPFDLERGPVLRLRLLRLQASEHRLLIAMHHIVTDDWSLWVFVSELAALYAAALRGEASTSQTLPPLPVQYADFAAWQREWLLGGELERQMAWWRQSLRGPLPVLDLPADRPRPGSSGVNTHAGARVHRTVPRELVAALSARGREADGTLYIALLAAFDVLLCRYTGSTDLLVGSPIANRRRVEVEGMIGYFVNLLALRGDLAGNPGFGELLARVRETTLGAYGNQDVPFDQLVEAISPVRDLSRNPLVDVLIILGNAPRLTRELAPGVAMTLRELESGVARVDLSLFLEEMADGLAAAWEYSTDLFDDATIERMAGHLEVLMAGLAAAPAAPVLELPLLTAAEQAELVAWNAEPAARPRPDVPDVPDVPDDATLHGLFAAQAARTPDALALIAGEERLSYAELAARSAALAARLRAAGVGPEVGVGIFLDRSAGLVAALLATLEAGGFYVPLALDYPTERLRLLLADSGAAVVLTRSGLEDKLPAHDARTLLLDRLEGVPSGFSAGAGPGNLAYLIYTSGSTGRPKAVAIEHRSAVVLMRWARREYSDLELSGMLASTSITFDMSVFELFAPLAWGGTVILAENALALPALPAAVAGAVRVIDTVPSAMAELLRMGGVPASVVTVNLGGEAVPRALADRIYAQAGIERLYNVYGPSEDTTFSTWELIERGSTRAPAIGRPLDGEQGWVVDANLSPVPVGVPGELYLGGAGVSRGYLGRPDLTAERFVPDPFSSSAGSPGARMYRVGDLVRYRPDGVLEFLGRLDHQVKIRGFRVELGEVEEALCRLPGVAAAAVLARQDAALGTHLAAYVVAGGAAGVVGELREGLRARLPEYMVPTAWKLLDTLPLTPNGKVDRRALAALEMTAGEAAAAGERTMPRGAVEEAVAAVFAEVLGVETVGARESFFELGGHSLLVTRVLSRLRRLFGVELSVRTLFENPTVAALARRIESASREAWGPEPPLTHRTRGEKLPLSFGQERLWFLDRFDPGKPIYNMPFAFRLRGPLGTALGGGVAALAAALSEIVRRHEALRTTFARVDAEPVQVIAPAAPHPLPVVDLAALPAAAREAEAGRLAAAESLAPFDLARGPLLRTTLLRFCDECGEDHLLLLNLHHIVADGWSIDVLVGELATLHAAALAGTPSPLPELAVQVPDFALWQREWLAGPVLAAQLAYWRQALASDGGDPPALDLPADRPRPPLPSQRGALAFRALPAGLAGAAEALGRRQGHQGTTLYMTLLASFAALLYRYTGAEDVRIGSPVANRNRPELEGLIGFFVNTLVLRADLAGEPSFAALLAQIREAALGAYAHQDLPFERLVGELAPGRDLSRNPLFQVSFVLQDPPPALLALGGGVTLEAEETADTGTAKFDLTLALQPSAAGLAATAEYATDLFDAATIDRLLAHFEVLLAAIVADPAARVADLPLLAAGEREQLAAWNRTATGYPREATIPALFAEQARRAPGALAVVAGEEALTYGELAARAGGLARRLRAAGVGEEVLVVLLLERSAGMVVAALAVLAAGGAYVPLDPKDPAERLRYVLADTGAPVVVARGGLPEGISGEGFRTLLLDDLEELAEAGPEILDTADPGNLAYVTYTSGSTGRPKGVAVPHQAVARLVRETDYLQLAPGDRVAHLSNPAFDAAIFEVWGALLNGATLVVIPREVTLSPRRLAAEIAARGISTLFLTTALFNLLVREDPRALRTPRAVLFGGEAVDPATVAACLAAGPPERLLHVYGPTEGTTFTTWHRVEAVAAIPGGPATVPIGLPLANTTVHVLDRWGGEVPVGVPGELYAGGDGVARGYFGRPDLTAERFVPDGQGNVPGARLYRTGDLVRRLESGAIEFLGRIDGQVKIRGFRIEPGEIEAALLAQPGVAAATVLVREDGPGERRLIAYVAAAAPNSDAGLSVAALREGLRARLPEPMIPAAFVVLPALPLTPNGKVDRRALAAIDPEPAGDAGEEWVAPRTPLEELVAGIWCEVLGVERVGAHDSFWDLGGHSLVATKVLARLHEAIDVELPLQALFEHPTPAGLAAAAGRLVQSLLEHGEGGEGDVIPQRPAVPATPPLSFAQQRLWLLDRLEPGSAAYNMPFPLRLRGALDAAVLARAASEVVRRHEALRTTFATVDGVPVQVIAPAAPAVALPLVDLGGLPAALREAEGARLLAAEAKTPFDLERGPLVRLALVRLGTADHLLLLDMHHIVSDGWSIGLFFDELSALYPAFAAGAPSPLAALPIQYADFAVWQRDWLRGEVLAGQLDYWRQRLAGAPPALELPTDRPRLAVQTHRGDVVHHVFPGELTQALHGLSRREGASLFMTLLAGFKLLLARLADQDDVVVGSPSAGRRRVETERLIGFFLNNLVLRSDLSGDPTFRQLLARVKEGALAAYRYQEVPFEKLLEELQPERQLSRTPFFQVLFNMITLAEARLAIPGVDAEIAEPPEPDAKFDFTLYVEERGGRIGISTVYNADLFDRARMEELPRQLERLLAQAVAAPGERAFAYSLVTPEAALRLPDPAALLGDEWMGAVHRGLSRSAERSPEALALRGADGEAWSYAELEAFSNRLARRLLAAGVGRGDVAAVWARRAPALAWALMGALKAGAAFMILDPAYPAERLVEYLRIGRPAAWLGVPGAPAVPAAVIDELAALGCGVRIELPAMAEERRAAFSGFSTSDPAVPVGPDDAACLTFTSGSTGRPKGVVGRHGPLSHFNPWFGRRFGLSAADRFGMLSGLSHDPLQRDVFTPLWLGAALCVPDPERIGEAGYLASWVRAEGVTVLNLTPAMLELLTMSAADSGEEAGMPSLRRVFVVGDLLRKSEVARLQRLAPYLAAINLYGSTETQRTLSFFEIPRPGEPAWRALGHEVLPLGRGAEDAQLLVLNRAGLPAGIGEAGELHLRSHHLAQGYLGDAALTAARFLPNPFASQPSPSDRIYKTGDLGRYRPDGLVDFAGRADFQVKIRGFRIELGEVEAALARFAGVRECVVVVREDLPGDRRLVAYLVIGGVMPPAAELHAFLARTLPDYMVPAAFVELAALPLTRTGKVDRRALPAPAPEETTAESLSARPLTPVEELLAALWSELLGRERIAAGDDFFVLGGHSLLATRLLSRVRDAFAVEMPLRALFETPTLAGFAAAVEAARRAADGTPGAPAIRPLPRDGGALPVSFAQRRLWFLDQLEPGSFAYNLAGGIQLTGALDPAAFAGALSEIVRRHESLRTTFAAADGEPHAVIAPPARFPLPVVDLAGLPPAWRTGELSCLAAADARRPFDLAAGPLLRCLLVRLAAGRHALLLAMHHTVSDGWSLGVLLREISALYPAAAAGEGSPLPELRVQYADLAGWQREWLRGAALAVQLGWWRAHLAGAPPLLDLPADRPRPAVESHRGGLATRPLGGELTAELEALARRLGATPFMVLLGAWGVLLARTAGVDDLVLGSPIANRGRSELEGMIGFFANTLVLRVDLGALGGNPRFPDLVRQVRESALGAYAHQDLPFEKLVEELHPDRELDRSPLFQATFALQNVPFSTLDLPGLTLAPLVDFVAASADGGRAQFDLDLALLPTADGLLARLEYSADLFDAATAERWAAHYRNLLAALVASEGSGQRVGEIDFLSSAERRQLLVDWNPLGTRPALPAPSVLDWIVATAATASEAPAVVGGDATWSYGGLVRRAAELERRLRATGVGPERVVAVALDRSPEMVAALLAVLRAGGAYLPLDLSLPAERLAWMLADAGAVALVTRASLLSELGETGAGLPRLLVDDGELADGKADGETFALQPDFDPASLAYVLYTSGSTGRPKEVGISRGALTQHAAAIGRLYALAAGDRVLQFAALSFDVAAEEIFPTLAAGATVVLVPDPRELPAEALLDRVEQQGLTVLNLPSPYWHEWVTALEATGRPLPPPCAWSW